MRPFPCMRHRALSSAIIVSIAIVANPARAVTIDGLLDGEYGIALSTQSTQTSFADTRFTPPYSEGSELDAAFGFVSDGNLYLFFAGNLLPFTSEPLTLPHDLHVFIDCAAGGQNQLRSDNPAVGPELKLSHLAGLRFDGDFSPDYWLDMSTLRGSRLIGYYSDLPATSGGSGYFLGRIGAADAGVFSGGTNPHGVRAGMNNTNTEGVPAGCGAAAGDGVTTGFEWSIPLAAIGNPTGAIKVCALVAKSFAPQVSNQVLGPLPPGTCSLGAPASVDFSAIPGLQYFVIDFAVPARKTSLGAVKQLYAR